MTEKTKITREQYWAALSCFLAACYYAQQATRLQEEMCEILEFENAYAGCISDEVYEERSDPIKAFVRALGYENIEVEEDAGGDSETQETEGREDSNGGVGGQT